VWGHQNAAHQFADGHCNMTGDAPLCTVTGVLDWVLSNQATSSSSQGSAQFEYRILWPKRDGSGKIYIVHEESKPIDNDPGKGMETPKQSAPPPNATQRSAGDDGKRACRQYNVCRSGLGLPGTSATGEIFARSKCGSKPPDC